ncbi:hypothetical protein ABEF95_002869 [Exophiala dermatitidis]
MNAPQIPERRPIKRVLQRTEEESTLEHERDSLNLEYKRLTKQLKPQNSFNSAYWETAAQVHEIRGLRSEVRRKISVRDFINAGGDEEGWARSEAAANFLTESKAEKVRGDICRRQAERVAVPPDGRMKPFRRSTSSKLGIGITGTGMGKRDSTMQGRFRADMIQAYNSTCDKGETTTELLWCPIRSNWFNKDTMTAAHIFGVMHGQQMMDTLFGERDEPELFLPRNGLIIHTAIEKKIDSGYYVIVPLLPENPTPEQHHQWQTTEPKEYQLRVLNPNDPYGTKIIDTDGITYNDLDGKKLEFRSDFRPRARYLYFLFCVSVLRQAWKENREYNILRKKLGKYFWGTGGRYMMNNMLLSLVEEVGHTGADLGEIAERDQDDSGEEDIVLAAASQQIQSAAKNSDDEDDEDDYDDDDDDDN